jgi:hypothetical protein
MTTVTVVAGWLLALKLNYCIWKAVRRVTKEKRKKIYPGDVKARWFSAWRMGSIVLFPTNSTHSFAIYKLTARVAEMSFYIKYRHDILYSI